MNSSDVVDLSVIPTKTIALAGTAGARRTAVKALGMACWIVVVACLSLSRQRGIPPWRTMWAEDGAVFFRGVWASPPGVSAIIEPYAGYIHFAPRVLVIPGSWFHAGYGSAYAAFTAALVCGVVSLSILHLTRNVLQSRTVRVVISLSPVVLPAMIWENLNNLTYLLWLFLYAGFWGVSATSRTRADTCVRVSLLVVGALSHPLLAIYLPMAAYVAWRRHDRGDRWATAALAGAVSVQALFAVVATPAPRQGREISELVMAGLHRVIGSAVLGERGLELGWNSHGWVAVGVAVLILIVILAVLGLGADRTKLGLALAALTYSAVALVAALFSRGTAGLVPNQGQYVPVGMRYFIVPILLVWTAVAVLADGYRLELRRRIAASLAVAIATIGIVSSWQPSNLRSQPPEWPYEVSRVSWACENQATKSVIASITPAGWVVDVPCRELR